MIAATTQNSTELLQDQLLELQKDILASETRLAQLHATLQTLKSSVMAIAKPLPAEVEKMTRPERFAKAKGEIFEEYGSLMTELAK